MAFLLDTNIVSSLRRLERLPPNAARFIDSLPEADCFLSVVSLMEIEKGIRQLMRRDLPQATVLRRWIERHRATIPANRILPVTKAIALRCAEIQVPDPRPYGDALLAATAMVHNLTVVTRNVADFRGIERCRVLDPWAA